MVPTTNNKHALSNKLPTYLQPLVCVGSARPSTALTGPGSDAASNLSITLNTWKPPDISSLHNVCRTGIWLIRTDANFYFPIRIIRLPPNRARGPRRSLGGPSGAQRSKIATASGQNMVELSGIEPLTPCLQSRCSPS